MINWIDLILILFNFIFFIGVQTLFLILVAKDTTKTQIDIIMKKAKILLGKTLEDKIKPFVKDYKPPPNNTNSIYTGQGDKDKKLLIKFILIPVCILVGIIIILFFLSKKYKNKWEPYHFKSLCLIFFGYITEILVYLMLIKQYKPINLSHILEKAVLKIEKSGFCLFSFVNLFLWARPESIG